MIGNAQSGGLDHHDVIGTIAHRQRLRGGQGVIRRTPVQQRRLQRRIDDRTGHRTAQTVRYYLKLVCDRAVETDLASYRVSKMVESPGDK